MPAYVLKIPSGRGRGFVNGRDSVMVFANSVPAARALAKNVILGSGYTATMWDEADVVELEQAESLEGFRMRVAILAAGVDVTVTGESSSSIDDLANLMVTALNDLDAIDGASYNSDTKVLTVCDADDDLAANNFFVEILPPVSDTFATPHTTIPGFVATSTGPGGENEVQFVKAEGARYGTFTLEFDGETTCDIDWNACDTEVRHKLEHLDNIDCGDLVVEGNDLATGYTITFQGQYAFQNVCRLQLDTCNLTTKINCEAIKGLAPVNEVQSFDLGAASAGNCTITLADQTTASVAYNANADAVESALEALSNIGSGNVSVTGGPLPASVSIEFIGALAGSPVLEIVVTSVDLEGATITKGTDIEGVSATNEQQAINALGYTDGTFTIDYDGECTDPLPFDATAAQVRSALWALDGITDSDIDVGAGPIGSESPVFVEFVGALAATDVANMCLHTSGLSKPTGCVETRYKGGALTATLFEAVRPQVFAPL